MRSLNQTVPIRLVATGRIFLQTIKPLDWIWVVAFGGLFILEAVLLALNIFHMRPEWDLNGEKNFPTHFHAGLLASIASLSGLIFLMALLQRLFRRTLRIILPILWLLLGVAFAYLSLDEANEWHEKITNVVMDKLGIKGMVSLAFWEVVFAPLLALTAGAIALLIIKNKSYVWEFSRLSRAALILWAIALIMEFIGLSIVGGLDGGFEASYMIEETCELAGSTLFLLALVLLIRRYIAAWRTGYQRESHPRVNPVVSHQV